MKTIFSSIILSVYLLTTNQTFSQEEIMLSGEKKAFIYHVIWKDKRLEEYLGPYFEYIGEPYLKRDGKTPKRDSVEWAIKNNGNNLLIRKAQLRRVSKGMLMELCNKLALHDINQVVKYRNSEEPHHSIFIAEYETLVDVLSNKLPPYAMQDEDGTKVPLLKMEKILAPTYSTKSKINVASSGGTFDPSQTKSIVTAINESIRIWVQNRAKQYFVAFGGRAIYLNNQLMSAGDGGGYAGASKEQKQDKWYKGLPFSIGFFYYLTDIKKDGNSGKQKVKAMHVPVSNCKTYANDTITNIHFDVWGKSPERQSTVVIQKGINSYILYGKDESNLLSPDSSYNKEGVTTYQMLIDELKNVHIAHYEEMIYGKRGYDYQIEFHTKQKDICLVKIKQVEYKLNKIRYTTGSGNITNYKPKDPKKNQPNSNESVKKQKKTTQDDLMYWYEKLEYHKGMVIKLKKEKEIAVEILANLKDKLGEMERNLGYRILTYQEKDGLYIFEDSSIFNYATQDFKFMGTKNPEEYNIRLLAFDDKVLSSKADELQIHWSITEEDEDESLILNRNLVNHFPPNKAWEKLTILSQNDSLIIREMIQFIIDNPKKIELELLGAGKGKILSNGKYEKDYQPEYFKEYNGDPKQNSDLNNSSIQIKLDKELIINVRSFTDGKIANYKPYTKEGIKLSAPESGVHPNELLTGKQTQNIIRTLIQELEIIGTKLFENNEAKEASLILEKLLKKSKVKVGSKSFKAYLKIATAKL